MPTLAKNVAHDYDPSVVFHTHSTNVPLLHSWIDDLVKLTETALPLDVNPNTDQLVQAMQRYDAIFREILRQMAIFSEPITKMTAKSWAGSLKLMDYVIKSYHRYVKHTTHLQAQAQLLLNERQAAAAATKVREDEFELERTTLRAKIRVLEAETEALKMSNRLVERENKHFRSIITSYVRSDELSEEMWSLFNDYKVENIDEEIQFNATKEATRSDTVDVAKIALRNINRLDIEMGEMQTLILKEEDRQRLLVLDLMKLMERSKAVFGDGRWTAAEKYVAGESRSVIKMVDKDVQVDEKDTYGVVYLGENDYIEEAGINPPLMPAGLKVKGYNVPYPLRSLMKSFLSVLRIPPITWTCQTIMAIYLHKIRVDREMDLQNKLRIPMPEFVHFHFKSFFGLQTQADGQVSLFLNACEYHMVSNKRVALFASQLGLYKKDEVASMDIRDTDFILFVISTCERIGKEMEQRDREVAQERLAIRRRKEESSGRKGAASATTDLKDEDSSAARMTIQLNVNPTVPRAVAIAATTEILSVWYQDGGQDYVLKVQSMQSAGKIADNKVNIDDFLEIMLEPWTTMRMTWEEHAKFLFQYHCMQYRVIYEAQFANDQGARDRETILAQCATKLGPTEVYRRPVRLLTKSIAEFEKESLKEDPNAAKKGGASANAPVREPVVELMSKKVYSQAIRLVLPLITDGEIDIYWRECCEIALCNINRILQTIWLRVLDDGSLSIDSVASKTAGKKGGTNAKANRKRGESFDDFYQEQAMVGSLNTVQASVRKPTFKDFYINLKTGVTQWALPYKLKTFSTCDLEVEAFVSQLLQRDVFSRSPLVYTMHLNPKDLWPNAEILYKQILAQEDKARRTAAGEFDKVEEEEVVKGTAEGGKDDVDGVDDFHREMPHEDEEEVIGGGIKTSKKKLKKGKSVATKASKGVSKTKGSKGGEEKSKEAELKRPDTAASGINESAPIDNNLDHDNDDNEGGGGEDDDDYADADEDN